jgi:peptide/nickel transport system permease protein
VKRLPRIPPLAAFVARRLAAIVVLLALISLGVFALLYIAPGNVVQALLGARQSNPELIRQLRHEYHLDDPFLTQYWIWLKGVLTHFDFGRSSQTGLPVTTSIAQRFGVTMFLAVYAFLISTTAGVSLGIASAIRKRSVIDRVSVAGSVLAASIPAYVTGVVLLYLFTVKVSWFPGYGPGTGFFDRLLHLTLPAITLGLTLAAIVVKLTRASMIETLDQDYVQFARARGVPRHRVLLTYGFRNAVMPVLTASGLVFGTLVTGAVLVEVVFALPGLGQLLVQAVEQKDIPLVQGVALLASAVVLLTNLVTDLLYFVVDPRIRHDRRVA